MTVLCGSLFLLSLKVKTCWGLQLPQYCSDGQSDWIFGSGVEFCLYIVYRHPLGPSGSLSPEITSSTLMFTLVLFSPSNALTTSLKALAIVFPLLASAFHVRVAARRRVVAWLLAFTLVILIKRFNPETTRVWTWT